MATFPLYRIILNQFGPRVAADAVMPFSVQQQLEAEAPGSTVNIKVATDEEAADYYTRWGTPVFQSLYIPPFDTVQEIRSDVKHSRGDFLFPPATLIDVSQSKRMVKTVLPGRNGSVKQMTGLDDWQITIRGIFTGGASQNKRYTGGVQAGPAESKLHPYRALQQLAELQGYKKEIPVQCKLFSTLNISHIVLDKVDTPSSEGGLRNRSFVVSALSDSPVTLKLKPISGTTGQPLR